MELHTISFPDVTPLKFVTAKATYGIGFLTAFVGGFCALFGIPNNMYTEKIKKAEALAMEELEANAKSIGADGVMDVRCQIVGLSFLAFGTAYKLSAEEKAKRVSKKETSGDWLKKAATNTTTSHIKGDWLKKAATNTTTSHIKVCPYCGEVVKSNRCEMCGKEINK